MAIPAGYSRLVLHGKCGNDIFETGVWVSGAVATQAAAQTLANSAWNLFLTSGSAGAQALIGADSSYTGLRAYCYPTGGPGATYIAEAAASPVVGTAPGASPFQTAMVVTLQTGAAGRRARGRMYLPAHGVQLLTTTHLFATADTDRGSSAVAGWLTALHGTSNPAVVLSTVAGSSRVITGTTTDNKPDIQRRRANKVIGTYVKTTTVP
jgi:hypothetical protein